MKRLLTAVFLFASSLPLYATGWLPLAETFQQPGAAFQCAYTTAHFYNCPMSVSTPAGYARNVAGVLQSFLANQPRQTNYGLLIEPAATNLALQSRTFGTTWALNSANITRSQNAIDPSGVASAAWSLIVSAGDSTTNTLTQSVTVTSNTLDYVLSVFVLAAGSDPGVCGSAVNAFSGGSSRTSAFNTFTGSVTDSSVAGSTVLVPYGIYWRNATVVTNTSKTANLLQFYAALNSSTNGACTSVSRVQATNGTTVYDFAQLEQGEQPTSPIITTTTSASRAADVVTVSGQSLDTNGGATVCVDAIPGVALLTVPAVTALEIDDGTANNILAFIRDTSREARIQLTAGGSLVANVDMGSWADLADNVMCASVSGTTLKTTRNGGAETVTTISANAGTITNVRVGANESGPTGVVTVENITGWTSALQ